MPGTEFLNPVWVWGYQLITASSNSTPLASTLLHAHAALDRHWEWIQNAGTKRAPAELQCPASSAPQTHPARHKVRVHTSAREAAELPLQRGASGRLSCAGKQKQKERTGRRENILRCQRFSTVPITDHSHMPGLKNDVNREIYTYLKSKDFINWSLLFCGTAVSLFRGLSNTAITATCMSLVQNSKINQIRIHMKFRGSFYYLPRILLMFSASFSWRDLLLKIFSLAFSITSCWKTQVVRFLFLTSLEKEHEWKIM